MQVDITNQGATLYLDGVIGGKFDGGYSTQDLIGDLRAVSDKAPLTVRINSPGGDVFDGFSMYNQLTERTGRVDVVVDGVAASAGSLVAMAGQTVTVNMGSQMMVHEAEAFVMGARVAELATLMGRLEKINADLVSVYSARSRMSAAQVRDAMAAETWYNAEEAIAAGLADKMASTKAAAFADSLTGFSYRRGPTATAERKPWRISHDEARMMLTRARIAV